MLLKFSLYLNLFLISNIVDANCDNLLRLLINDRLGRVSTNLYGKKAKKLYKKKDSLFISVGSLIGPKELAFSKKIYSKDLILRTAIEEKVLPEAFLHAVRTMRDAANDPVLLNEWAKNLYMDIAVEVYAEGSHAEKANYYLNGKLSKNAAISVLFARLEQFGFVYGFERVTKILESFEFSEILANKKLIWDQYFYKSTHGDLIHILQLDYMIYALKKAKLDPKLLISIYEWMGKGEEIALSNGVFHPLNDGWNAIFDSREADLTSPDLLNPVLMAYFDWID